MVDNNRRRILKAGGTALGLSTLPGITAATKTEESEVWGEIELHDRTLIAESDEKAVWGIDLSKNRNSRWQERSAQNKKPEKSTRKRFVVTVEKNSGAASMGQVSTQKYESLAANDKLSVESNEVTIAADDDIVVRSDVYAHDNGSCAAYDYTHVWAAVTAEFTDEVGDLGWQSVSAALIAVIGSSSLSGGVPAVLIGIVTAIGGLAAIVTDTYELTVGGAEWDKTVGGWNQTMYSSRAAPGYHKGEGELTTIVVSPGHPGRA